MGPGQAEGWGTKQLGLCVKIWCCQVVEGMGAPEDAWAILTVQMGMPGAGGVRVLSDTLPRRLAKKPCCSKPHMGESWA